MIFLQFRPIGLMALRYLARRALQQRALVPRVLPSAGSRPVSTRGSSPQGLLTNDSKAAATASKGNYEPQPLGRDFSKLTIEQISQKLDKVDSLYKAVIEDRAAIYSWGGLMGFAAVGVGLAFLHDYLDNRNERIILVVERK